MSVLMQIFRSRPGLFHGNGRVLLVIGLVASGAAVSCAGGGGGKGSAAAGTGARGGGDRAAEGRVVMAPGRAAQGSSGDGTQDGAAGWSIVLESFQGAQSVAIAQSRLAEVARLSGLADVSVRTTPQGAAIVAGLWRHPSEPGAQEALRRVRSVSAGAERPFAQAFLAPPVRGVDAGELPELNLASAKSIFGSRAVYTLQIGVYEAPDRAQAKRAAEQAALRLRREGELAFYFHGPVRSMVTVGVFSDRDLQGPARAYGPAITAVHERYPINLLNGQFPIVERVPGAREQRQQPSTLVRIPG